MESVIDFEFDKIYDWKGDSVFQRHIGCQCRKLFSELTFVYTLLGFLSCNDQPDTNLEALLEQVYLLCSKVLEEYTGCDLLTMIPVIQSALSDGCRLKKEIEQLGTKVQAGQQFIAARQNKGSSDWYAGKQTPDDLLLFEPH